eukprot:1158208-Pelagomonas_calceolata.AAC.17
METVCLITNVSIGGELGRERLAEQGLFTTPSLVCRLNDLIHVLPCDVWYFWVRGLRGGHGELIPCIHFFCAILYCRFLPWPEEALTAVSGKFIDEFPMACSNEAKDALKTMYKIVSLNKLALDFTQSGSVIPSPVSLVCDLPLMRCHFVAAFCTMGSQQQDANYKFGVSVCAYASLMKAQVDAPCPGLRVSGAHVLKVRTRTRAHTYTYTHMCALSCIAWLRGTALQEEDAHTHTCPASCIAGLQGAVLQEVGLHTGAGGVY